MSLSLPLPILGMLASGSKRGHARVVSNFSLVPWWEPTRPVRLATSRTSVTFRKGKLMPPADPRRILERLEQLHVPRQQNGTVGSWTMPVARTWIVCAYCGTAYPCRERRIMNGEEDL